MILYFSGTGNSKYIAKRIAEAIRENTVDLNMKIKENDTSPLQTGRDVIIVTPTYAWRIPKIVSEWIEKRRWIDMKHLSQSSLENMNRFFMKLFHQIFIWTLLSFRRRKRTITINLSPWEWAHME